LSVMVITPSAVETRTEGMPKAYTGALESGDPPISD